MRKAKYQEGLEATENFERGMKALFQVPKADIVKEEKRKRQRKSATVRKTKRSDKD
jgi:hypothetical protein